MFQKAVQRAVVYARVSSEDQAERGTIENQLEFARKYCDLHQIEILDWYKDDGVTGTIPLELRPEGTRLLEDARTGKIDLVLIYKLDRLARSARITLNAVYQLEQYGTKIRSMTEPFDTGDPSGRFLLTILAGVADLERETILDRMWHGANRAARNGKWLGGIVPFGYHVGDEGYLNISTDPLPGLEMSESDVIRLIYQMSADRGLSCIAIADYLNAIGVPPSYAKDGRQVKKGKRSENTAGIWRPSRIRNMIVNSTYKGLHEYGKRTSKTRDIITREVPAIVDAETWERAQKVLRNNQIEATRNSTRQYLLRGLVKCGECGLNYLGTKYSGKGGQYTAYYRCNGKRAYRGPKEGECDSRNVPAEWLEEHVWQQCVGFIQHPGETVRELEAAMSQRKAHRADLTGELELANQALLDKDREKQAVLDLYRRNLISSTDVEKQLDKIAREQQSIEGQIKAVKKQIASEQSQMDKFETAEALLISLQAKLTGHPDWETKRDIIRTLVKEIVIHTDHDGPRPRARATIRFTFIGAEPTKSEPTDGENTPCIINRTAVPAATPATQSASAPAPMETFAAIWREYPVPF